MIRKLAKNECLPMSLLLSADPSEKLVREYTNRGDCYVYEIDGEIIGIIVLISTRPKTVEIVNLAIKENFQNHGFGKQLIHYAIQNAKDVGYHTMEIGTGSIGTKQLMLYQRCGFRMVSIDRDFFVRHYETPIIIDGMQLRDMVRLSQEL
ncbi:GNAT family N-acetyltransferase [Staphylococcus caeli]|uniref:GNAT family N-acetyltransferase n=1 Tax=Staphylococcus caeli TaxID=2201815 RepID=UPI003F54A5D9